MIKQSSKRTNQGGSVLIFIIVAVVLGLALVGSVAFIRHKGELAQSQTPIFGPATAPLATNDGKSSDNTSPSPQPAEKPAPAAPKQDTSAQTNTQASSPAAELPKTGPADMLGGVLVVGFVTMAAVSYARSRHLSWQL